MSWASRIAGLLALGVIGEIILRALRNGRFVDVSWGLGLTAFAIIVAPRLMMPFMTGHQEEVRQLKAAKAKHEQETLAKQQQRAAVLSLGGSNKKKKKSCAGPATITSTDKRGSRYVEFST